MQTLRKIITALIGFVLTVLVVVFVLSNREAATVSLWPLPIALDLPLYLVIAGAFLSGFLVGGATMWVSDGRVRRTARARGREVSSLERKMSDMERELERSQARPGGTLAAPTAGDQAAEAAPMAGLPVVR